MVQRVANITGCTAFSTSCATTVASTGAGNVIVMGVRLANSTTITSTSGGGTSVLCGVTCQNGNSASGFVDVAYILSSTSGVTSITLNFGTSTSADVFIWEVSSTTTVTLDTSSSALRTANCTSCAGVGLTLTGANDAIFTVAACAQTCSAISGGYTADPATPWPNGNGMARLINTTTGTAPNWTQAPTGNLATAAIAFKD